MSKKWRIAPLLAVAMLLAILISACGSDSGSGSSTPTATSAPKDTYTFKCEAGSLKIGGSTALKPLADALAPKYMQKCSSANITVDGQGSKTGLANAENKTWDIGNSDLFADATTQADLVDHQVAVVVFTVVINPKVTGVTSLTTQQIKDIYTGKTTNWKEVGGNDLEITVVSRPASSGTRATFKQYILGGVNESPAKANNLQQDTTSLVLQTVAQTDGAIGYAALGDAQKQTDVTILKIDGKEPSAANVQANSYKFWNIEHMYTNGQATGLVAAFIDYVTKSDDGKTSATDLKFVPISTITKDVLDTHQPKA